MPLPWPHGRDADPPIPTRESPPAVSAMTDDGNVTLLLARLNSYAEALQRHNVAVTRAYENALESLTRLRQVYAGAAADDFMAHWDRTTAALEHYVEGSRRLSEILEERIATLRKADRPGLDAAREQVQGSAPAPGEPSSIEGAGAHSKSPPDLGMDPATGEFRPSEYETAARIQRERGVVLRRSANPGVDWVDESGNTYDAVGNFSSDYFDRQWANLQTRILDHMSKADFVPVDVSRFTDAQIAQVREFIESLGPAVYMVGQ